jgi:glutamate 5-kinase
MGLRGLSIWGLRLMTRPVGPRVFPGRLRRVVLKLGSSVVTTERGLDRKTIRSVVDDIISCRKEGYEFIIVSSGAVAAGVRRLMLPGGAKSIPQKQAAASVGQTRLMAAYEDAFSSHGVKAAQMLLTRDDLAGRQRYLNARNTLTTLLSWGVIPIINENDTVVVDEIKFGDNDNLSALVATLAEADLLLVLTDMEGLMDCDPRSNPEACLIPLVERLTPDIKRLAGESTSQMGRGGMTSKLQAAEKAGLTGIPTVIAKGKTPKVVSRVVSGESLGTLILPAKERISARKHWLRYNLEPEGTIFVDEGAATAIGTQGKSLLPIGVTSVSGHFDPGAAVEIMDPRGLPVARGLVNYSSEEIKRILGRCTAEIDWVLGYRRNDEVAHADDMVVLVGGEGGP